MIIATKMSRLGVDDSKPFWVVPCFVLTRAVLPLFMIIEPEVLGHSWVRQTTIWGKLAMATTKVVRNL
jgi:hypothetical protein